MIFSRPLGEWTPDAPSTTSPGLVTAKGCYPVRDGYAPFLSPVEVSLPVFSSSLYGVDRFSLAGDKELILTGSEFGILGLLFQASGSSLYIAGPTPPVSGFDTDEMWVFERFGSDIYVTSKAGGTYYAQNVETALSFGPLASAPSGNAMARVDDFLIFGDITDVDATDQPFRIRWSQFNNPAGEYTTDLATQAGFLDMPQRFGKVTAIAGGDVGLIFQERGLSQIDYVGGATAFRISEIRDDLGCPGQASMVAVAGSHYFLWNKGFAVTGGGQTQLISNGRVWEFFLRNVNTSALHRVQGAVNEDRSCIVWNYYGLGSSSYNRQIIYNYEQDTWSHAEEEIDWIFPSTYREVIGEGEPIVYRIIGGFKDSTSTPGSHSAWRFTGDPVAAEFETGNIQLSPGKRTFISEVRPIVEGDLAPGTTVSLSYRNNSYGTDTSTSAAALGAHGFAPFNVDGRFVSVKVNIPAGQDWSEAVSIEITGSVSGTT